MIFKNVSGQGLYVYAHDTSADEAKTGDAGNITANLSKDGAAQGATNDTNPTEIGGGVYWFDFTQAETNCDMLALIPESATADVALDPVLVSTTGGAVPNATAGANGGLATVDANNRIAGVQGTKNTLDDLNDVASGAQMDLVDAPNATAISAIQSGLSTHDADAVKTAIEADGAMLEVLHNDRLTSARAGYLDKLNVSGTLAAAIWANATRTLSGTIGNFDDAADLDDYVDMDDSTQWQHVQCLSGSGTEVRRKDLKDENGDAVTASTQSVVRHDEPS